MANGNGNGGYIPKGDLGDNVLEAARKAGIHATRKTVSASGPGQYAGPTMDVVNLRAHGKGYFGTKQVEGTIYLGQQSGGVLPTSVPIDCKPKYSHLFYPVNQELEKMAQEKAKMGGPKY